MTVLRTLVVAIMLILGVIPVYGEVAILTAGVGAEDRQSHEDFSLKLVFFVRGGPYLADIEVKILDEHGSVVVEQVSKGPWLYVDLPLGRYSVIATRANGERQGAMFEISGNGQHQVALAFKP